MEDNDIAADTVQWMCRICSKPSVYPKGSSDNCYVCDQMIKDPNKYTQKQIINHFINSKNEERYARVYMRN